MISDDPSTLAAPRRAREAWEQAETLSAQSFLQTIQAIQAAHARHYDGRADPLVSAERLEAVLAGVVQAYALALVETGLVLDEQAQSRIMRRGLFKADLCLVDLGHPRADLEAVLLEELERRGKPPIASPDAPSGSDEASVATL